MSLVDRSPWFTGLLGSLVSLAHLCPWLTGLLGDYTKPSNFEHVLSVIDS